MTASPPDNSSKNPPAAPKSGNGEARAQSSGADLIVESDVGPETSEFGSEQSRVVTEAVAKITTGSHGKVQEQGWIIAQRKVESFRPLPWFLWRLSLSVFSKPVGTEELNEGMILGLRRLLFAAASDPVIGAGTKVNSVKKALSILPADVIAGISIVHSVCRRLSNYGHDSIWKPILDEALVQAQIGFELGAVAKNIGKGRGLLSGFAGQIGLAILVACGDKKQAAETIEKMSAGEANSAIGKEVYGCEPMQVSATLLAASGCGPDAANGIAVSGLKSAEILALGGSRSVWAASCHAVEALRRGKGRQLGTEIFSILDIDDASVDGLTKRSIKIARAGHSWQWIE